MRLQHSRGQCRGPARGQRPDLETEGWVVTHKRDWGSSHETLCQELCMD